MSDKMMNEKEMMNESQMMKKMEDCDMCNMTKSEMEKRGMKLNNLEMGDYTKGMK